MFRSLLLLILLATLSVLAGEQAPTSGAEPLLVPAPAPWPSTGDGLVHEGKSPFSHYKVVDEEGKRFLKFVHDDGVEVIESGILLGAPHSLIVPYTRSMFANLLLRPAPERCLIVGLGGGSMVHFLRHHRPGTSVDVVEIDPAIVEVAAKYFGVVADQKVRIFTEDAFDYLKRSTERYDVIYMDAFLKPGGGQDASGIPLRLKTRAFLRDLRGKLRPDGLLVVNLHHHKDTWDDILALRDTFPNVYRFPVPGRGNLIVVASTSERELDAYALRQAGRQLDAEGGFDFSFERLAATLELD